MSERFTPSARFEEVFGRGANFRLGFKRALPIMLGYAPVGFAFGVLAVKNGIPPALAIAMSVVMFAGAGQFITLSLWISGAGLVSSAIAVLVTNLRYMLMAVALLPYIGELKGIRRLVYGWQITDELFAVHVVAFNRGWPINYIALFSATTLAQASWVIGTASGVFCGSLVADVRPLGLDYALTAMFIALLVPMCMDRLHILTAILAAFFSVALRYGGLDHWNVILGTIAAATIATIVNSRRNRVTPPNRPDRAEMQQEKRPDTPAAESTGCTANEVNE